MFEYFGVELQKKVDAQVIVEVGSSTIMGCGFDLIQEGDPSLEQGVQTPTPHVSRCSSNQPPHLALPQEQQCLQDKITAMKGAFQEEKKLSAKRHENLLAILTALQAKPSPPAS